MKHEHRHALTLFALALLAAAPFLFAVLPAGLSLLEGSLLGLWSLALCALLLRLNRLAREPLANVASALDALRHGDTQFRPLLAHQSPELHAIHVELERLRNVETDVRRLQLARERVLQEWLSAWPWPLLQTDPNARVLRANNAAQQLLPQGRVIRDLAELGFQRMGDRWQTQPGSHAASFVWRCLQMPGDPDSLWWWAQDLRAEFAAHEREQAQKLIRVLSHEVRNSLTPIRSLAQSLRSPCDPHPLSDATREQALRAIEARADHLNAFVSAYAQLANLPAPKPKALSWSALRDSVQMLTSLPCDWPESDAILWADPEQIEALFLNLFRNAEQAGATQLQLHCSVRDQQLCIRLRDNGSGIANPDNLFVPLYTTKPGGQGIGLSLCRQIAHAHGGDLSLRNHEQGGAEAVLLWPSMSD